MHKWLIGVGVLLALWLSAPSVGAQDAGGPVVDAGAPVATAVELTVTPNRPRYGEKVQVRARVTSAAGERVPTGTVRFAAKSPSGNTETAVALDAAGYASLEFVPTSTKVNELAASYTGDATHTPSSWSVPLYIDKASSSTALSSSSNPAKVGTLRVTATVAAASAAPRVPSGKVHFFVGNGEVAALALNANGQAVLDATKYKIGLYDFSVRYDGDENFIESAPRDALAQKIEQYATTVKVDISPTKAVFGDPVTYTITIQGADGGFPAVPHSVTLYDSFDGYNNWQKAVMLWVETPGKVTYTPKGSQRPAGGNHTLSVRFYGDDKYDYAEGSATLVVTQAPTKTTLTGTGSSLEATISSDTKGFTFAGSVDLCEGSVRVGGGRVDEFGSGRLTIEGLSTGTHDVVVVYNGNRDFASSRSEPLTIQYTAPPPKPDGGTGWPYDGGYNPPPSKPPSNPWPTYPPYDAGPLPDYDDYSYDDEYASPSCAASPRPVSQGAALLGAVGMALVFLRRRGGRRPQ
ncbi:Ig-like domain-containing protein [Pendulispora rubella]|uniref:Ig-like domain-containing protein n=1 Tax=Pendulispora rubella TaxID=2741070 RepID=A0ABZ2LFT0_9BACT